MRRPTAAVVRWLPFDERSRRALDETLKRRWLSRTSDFSGYRNLDQRRIGASEDCR